MKYEYKVVAIDATVELPRLLDQHSQDGWRLAHILSMGYTTRLIFERPVPASVDGPRG